MKRVLILTVDTGLGHRRAAEAVQVALDESHGGDCETLVANPVDYPDVPSIIKRIEDGYDSIVTDEPTFYALTYHAIGTPIVAGLVQTVSAALLNDAVADLITMYHPDSLVTTHPAFTQPVLNVFEKTSHSVPFCVVVTDLVDVHPLWFHPGVDCTFVPTGAVYRQALDNKISKERIRLTGLPVHPDFARETREPDAIRAALGWELETTTALIVGSVRSRQINDIANLLDRSGLPLQLIIVCGDDEETKRQLDSQQWRGSVFVYGLVHTMAEMMHAADFVISKGGGLIVSESLACGRPLVLYEALPGQEVGNVRYVVGSGAGEWSPGPISVLATTYAWLMNGREKLRTRQAAAQRIGKPRAAHEIAEHICKLTFQSDRK